MAIQTTCIGAYPKPDYLQDNNWRETEETQPGNIRGFNYVDSQANDVPKALLDRATAEAIADQVHCGVDIPTDGEQRRENYIHYHCRHLEGIDFQNLTRKIHRNGAAVADLPTITGKIIPRDGHFLDKDYEFAQSCTENSVKITLPGPITIMDTTADAFYHHDRALALDLAAVLNYEIRALAEAGCRHIQVDEPLFARNVDLALAVGIEALEKCFEGVPEQVVRTMHMCCGYPGHLDDEDYEKANPNSYRALAQALDACAVDNISIEDAHRHNDLSLLEQFQDSTVIFGCVAIATTRVETSEGIARRLGAALNHIDAHRLIAAPDCGLTLLGRDLAMTKLKRMCEAAGGL